MTVRSGPHMTRRTSPTGAFTGMPRSREVSTSAVEMVRVCRAPAHAVVDVDGNHAVALAVARMNTTQVVVLRRLDAVLVGQHGIGHRFGQRRVIGTVSR